jgi:uroporphyrinogen-III synthase
MISGPEAAASNSSAVQSQSGDDRRWVVVTRAESVGGPLSAELDSLGLPVLLWPAVTVTAADPGPLYEALGDIQGFDWIVFASRHAVVAVIERLPTAPAGVRIAAIGQATARVLQQRGWTVHLLPPEANAAELVSAFERLPLAPGARVLYPASSRALPTITAGLTRLGAEVLQLEAYRTAPTSLDVEGCRAWIERQLIGAVTFASPSAVEELENALGRESLGRLLDRARAVAIGPTTARELTARGYVPVLAESATLHGLATTTFRLLQTRP